jgi:hypothetical protein
MGDRPGEEVVAKDGIEPPTQGFSGRTWLKQLLMNQ